MKSIFTYLAVIVALHSATAQEFATPMTLSDAIIMATSTNPAIEAARYAESVASSNRKAAIGLRMPQIYLSGNFTHLSKDIAIDANHLKSTVESTATDFLKLGTQNGALSPQLASLITESLQPLMTKDWGLTLQKKNMCAIGGEIAIPIYTGGRINAANRTAEIGENIAFQATAQTYNMLISEVVTRYFGLALAAQVIEVRQAAADGIAQHLNSAIALEQSGMIPRSERLYVGYKMSQAERELQDAKLRYNTIMHALSVTLAGEPMQILPTTTMFVCDSIEDISLFYEQATMHNPILATAGLQRQMADEGVKAERADYLPQIAITGAGSLYSHQLSDILPRWAVGLGINLKIFDGFAREHHYAAAKTRVKYAEQIEYDAYNNITNLIEALYNELLNCRNKVSSLQSSILFAEEYLRDIKIAFNEGMAAATDVIDAELNLSKARIERIEAAYTYDITLVQLLEAAGISDLFMDYCNDPDARHITFDNKQL